MNINTIRLRLILGVLAILLPWIVLIQALLYGYGFPDSISATYYIDTCIAPFMIILGAASFLLICYSGYDKHDDIICSVTGVLGFGICLFSCNKSGELANELVGTFHIRANISGWLHNACAVLFFLLLAYNSYFLFTKSSGDMTLNKKRRNLIYRICGIGMLTSLALILPATLLNIYGATWFVEMLALSFFGLSWLTKCDIFPFLFCDSAFKD